MRLYAGLARLGTTVALTDSAATTAQPPRMQRLIDPVAAWYVGNVLLGTPPPENAAGGRIAFKTGTSYGYRDAWAVGFDGKRTIGVWVGRPDGAPVPGLVGRTAAAPILFDAFARLGRQPAPLPHAPRRRCSPPMPSCRCRCSASGRTGCRAGRADRRSRIMFPPNGARLELAAGAGEKPDPIALKVAGGVQPLTVLVNGVPLAASSDRRTLFFTPDGPGFVRLTVMDATGATDSVVVRVQ